MLLKFRENQELYKKFKKKYKTTVLIYQYDSGKAVVIDSKVVEHDCDKEDLEPLMAYLNKFQKVETYWKVKLKAGPEEITVWLTKNQAINHPFVVRIGKRVKILNQFQA